jgi:hypothetical protein
MLNLVLQLFVKFILDKRKWNYLQRFSFYSAFSHLWLLLALWRTEFAKQDATLLLWLATLQLDLLLEPLRPVQVYPLP